MIHKLSTARLGILRGSQMMFADFADGGEMWTGKGPRERRHPVLFTDAFTDAPVVTVTISMWDMAQETAFRADISAEEVTAQGFDLVFRTWSDTRIARIRADWVALGSLRDDDLWEVD